MAERCNEDPYHHSLEVTAADAPGPADLGWRTPELRSPILTRRSKRPLRGLPSRRLDHVNPMASDVTVQKELFEKTLGFGTRERVVDFSSDTEIGVWMSVNILGHEMAVTADSTGSRGRLHHLAFWYGVPQHNTDAAELCRESGRGQRRRPCPDRPRARSRRTSRRERARLDGLLLWTEGGPVREGPDMNLSVHFVGGPADGTDAEYDMTAPAPRLYLTDDDDRWRAVYQLAQESPLIAGRWQYREVPDVFAGFHG